MQFVSLYNFKGGGTEQITGIANENMPSDTDTINQDPNVFFNGQFSNLSRTLVHIRLEAFKTNGQTTLHKHDIRAYESLDLRNIPLRSISVYVEPNIRQYQNQAIGVMFPILQILLRLLLFHLHLQLVLIHPCHENQL